MKCFGGLPWMGIVLAVPAVASAQVTVSDGASDAQRLGRPRTTITLGNGTNAARSGDGSDGSLIPEFHTVQHGDTLWDISGYYFENPWRWPMVWGRNPQITNPHWIFPGDQVRLMNAGDPTRPVTQVVPGRQASGNRLTRPRPQVPRGTVFLREEAWATPDAVASSGSIIGAPEESLMLAEGDQVYLQFDRRAPNVGEAYTIYQVAQATRGSDRNAGTVVRVLGTAVVDAWDRERHVATARITESLEPIERGERVAIVQRQFSPVPPVTNERDLAGHIVATPQPRTIVGGQYVVIIDRGEQDGVRLGNRMFLTRRGDPFEQSTTGQGRYIRMTLDRDGDGVPDEPATSPHPADNSLPVEVMGEIMVVAVHPHTCVGIVTGVDRELELGQPVVMRRGY